MNPLIYQQKVELTLGEVKRLVDLTVSEKSNKSQLSKFQILIGTLLFYMKLPVLPAFGASLGVNILIRESRDIYTLANELFYMNRRLSTVNSLEILAKRARTEFGNVPENPVLGKTAIIGHINQVDAIASDCKTYFSGIKSNIKWSIAMKVLGVTGPILMAVGVFIISKPLILAGGITYVVSCLFMPKDYRNCKPSESVKNINEKINQMLGVISVAKNMNNKQIKTIYISTYPIQGPYGKILGGGYPFQQYV
jgi:hypothetical protein